MAFSTLFRMPCPSLPATPPGASRILPALAAGLVALAAALPAAGADLGNSTDLDAIRAAKDARIVGVPQPVPQVGGDNIATAVPIPAIPYTDTGNTCGYLNDYDATCPFTGSVSPDVVYRYTPAANTMLEISLCSSSYDTKVYVYRNVVGDLVACNDDACGVDGWRSELTSLPMYAGNTYYIVVDGYGGDCGDYRIDLYECCACWVPCPPGGLAEGEMDCHDDYEDHTNGGCNSVPPVFTPLPCSADGSPVTVCGRQGGFDYGVMPYRDTDWFEVAAENNPAGITVCLTAEYWESYFVVLQPDCANIHVVDSIFVPCGTPTCLAVPPGRHWIFVTTNAFGADVGCGWRYNLDVTGSLCPTVSVAATSWGCIKARYR